MIEQKKNLTTQSLVIGKYFDISSKKTIYVLSGLGWIKQGLKGWLDTSQGKRLGAQQREDSRPGVQCTRLSESIIYTPILKYYIDNITVSGKPQTGGK